LPLTFAIVDPQHAQVDHEVEVTDGEWSAITHADSA